VPAGPGSPLASHLSDQTLSDAAEVVGMVVVPPGAGDPLILTNVVSTGGT
jgi:hypothetical protein